MNFDDLKRRTLAHMGVPCSYTHYTGDKCYSCESREDELNELLIAFAHEVEYTEVDPETYLRQHR